MADSKRLLADALPGLMECKPLDQVRVAEIASAADRVLCLALTPEHMTGKRVKES